MLFTMLNGSVCNILSNPNATSKCVICGTTPKEINTKNVRNSSSAAEQYRFGLSTLQCWIRFLECILHIGYRLRIYRKVMGSWGNKHKEFVEANKKRIQSEAK